MAKSDSGQQSQNTLEIHMDVPPTILADLVVYVVYAWACLGDLFLVEIIRISYY